MNAAWLNGSNEPAVSNDETIGSVGCCWLKRLYYGVLRSQREELTKCSARESTDGTEKMSNKRISERQGCVCVGRQCAGGSGGRDPGRRMPCNAIF
jgi:hypothetical protein